MTETSFEGDLNEGSEGDLNEGTDTSGGQGGYEQPGAYTAPDGTTGYSGLQSGGRDPGEEPSSDYEASVGAALSVGLLALGLGVDGVAAGLASAGVISAGDATAAGVGYMSGEVVIEMGVAGYEMFFND